MGSGRSAAEQAGQRAGAAARGRNPIQAQHTSAPCLVWLTPATTRTGTAHCAASQAHLAARLLVHHVHLHAGGPRRRRRRLGRRGRLGLGGAPGGGPAEDALLLLGHLREGIGGDT